MKFWLIFTAFSLAGLLLGHLLGLVSESYLAPAPAVASAAPEDDYVAGVRRLGDELLACERARNQLLQEKLDHLNAEEKRLLAEAVELANRKDKKK